MGTTRVIAGSKLRGVARFSPFLLLLGLVVFSVSALASGPGPSEPSAASMWPIWGAAALQVAVTLVGGLLLWQIQRSTALADQRLASLEKRLDKTDEIVLDLKTQVMTRPEVRQELGEAKTAAGTIRSELREDLRVVQHSFSEMRADNIRMHEKMDKILRIMGAERV